jgi:hypothetical protein
MRTLISLFFLVAMEMASPAHTFQLCLFRCPLCTTAFKEVMDRSGTQMGMRLDFKPLGHIAAPWRVPVCPKCRFVLYKGGGQPVYGDRVFESSPTNQPQYTAEEVKDMKAFVASAGYAKLPADAPSYQRLALIREHQKLPHHQVAYTWLQASWQVEDNLSRCQECLENCARVYDKCLASAKPGSDEYSVAVLVRGEIYRRMGQFKEAAAWFAAHGSQATGCEFSSQMIVQQLKLIGQRDAEPQNFEEPDR